MIEICKSLTTRDEEIESDYPSSLILPSIYSAVNEIEIRSNPQLINSRQSSLIIQQYLRFDRITLSDYFNCFKLMTVNKLVSTLLILIICYSFISACFKNKIKQDSQDNKRILEESTIRTIKTIESLENTDLFDYYNSNSFQGKLTDEDIIIDDSDVFAYFKILENDVLNRNFKFNMALIVRNCNDWYYLSMIEDINDSNSHYYAQMNHGIQENDILIINASFGFKDKIGKFSFINSNITANDNIGPFYNFNMNFTIAFNSKKNYKIESISNITSSIISSEAIKWLNIVENAQDLGNYKEQIIIYNKLAKEIEYKSYPINRLVSQIDFKFNLSKRTDYVNSDGTYFSILSIITKANIFFTTYCIIALLQFFANKRLINQGQHTPDKLIKYSPYLFLGELIWNGMCSMLLMFFVSFDSLLLKMLAVPFILTMVNFFKSINLLHLTLQLYSSNIGISTEPLSHYNHIRNFFPKVYFLALVWLIIFLIKFNYFLFFPYCISIFALPMFIPQIILSFMKARRAKISLRLIFCYTSNRYFTIAYF